MIIEVIAQVAFMWAGRARSPGYPRQDFFETLTPRICFLPRFDF